MKTKQVLLKATDGTELILTLPVPYIDYVGNLKIEAVEIGLATERKLSLGDFVTYMESGNRPVKGTLIENGGFHFVQDGDGKRYFIRNWDKVIPIPDKKKLPKTKVDFKAVFNTFQCQSLSLHDFLNKYYED